MGMCSDVSIVFVPSCLSQQKEWQCEPSEEAPTATSPAGRSTVASLLMKRTVLWLVIYQSLDGACFQFCLISLLLRSVSYLPDLPSPSNSSLPCYDMRCLFFFFLRKSVCSSHNVFLLWFKRNVACCLEKNGHEAMT